MSAKCYNEVKFFIWCLKLETEDEYALCFHQSLTINQFAEYDFLHLGLTAIHQSHPCHLVTGFQFLGHASSFDHLRQKRVHAPLNAGQVIVCSAGVHQYHPQLGLMFLEVGTAKITIFAIKLLCCWALVKYQVGNVVVADFGVGQFCHFCHSFHQSLHSAANELTICCI